MKKEIESILNRYDVQEDEQKTVLRALAVLENENKQMGQENQNLKAVLEDWKVLYNHIKSRYEDLKYENEQLAESLIESDVKEEDKY